MAEPLSNGSVCTWEDPDSGLVALLAVDDMTLGPAVGGIRTHRYGTRAEELGSEETT